MGCCFSTQEKENPPVDICDRKRTNKDESKKSQENGKNGEPKDVPTPKIFGEKEDLKEALDEKIRKIQSITEDEVVQNNYQERVREAAKREAIEERLRNLSISSS
ncbi:unnamed protein product [Moneuplotes crassus]|uniref:Uncharacterized protein n=1 Tax=Euplotes crassus TaxID=5936 RepID=A0AAD1XEU7_EUPCR|nr:unnamed protein product [Moneuplotes crassus]